MKAKTDSDRTRELLHAWFQQAEAAGRQVVAVRAGDLHKALFPHWEKNQLANVSRILKEEIDPTKGDKICAQPEKGAGSNLVVLFYLPR